MPAAWVPHVLHQEAWKRSTRTFFPMSERESKVSPPLRSGSRMAGAAGAAPAGAGAKTRTARATTDRKRVTPHSIAGELAADVPEMVENAGFYDLYCNECCHKSEGMCGHKISHAIKYPMLMRQGNTFYSQ